MKKNKISSRFLAVLLLCSFACSKSPQKGIQQKKPNIILIMSDDMGYSDLGCYGGEINTPNLDKLAKNGLQFTQFYNSARCCPTRASLMTGLHPHQTGIGHMTNPPDHPKGHNYGIPSYEGSLNKQCVTIAQVLKPAGYHTLMTGKWHLGTDFEDWPLQRGFDKFYGFIPGAGNFFKPTPPRGITYMNESISITDPDFYTTDAFTDKAIQFIDEAQAEDEDKPFFLYLAYNAPHWPLQAPAEDVEKYRGKYMQGWGKLREERYARMKAMGLIDPEWELTAQDARSWKSLDPAKKDEMDHRMAIYAAMVDRMDQNIGRLVDYLEKRGELDNTMIVFLNDNGACAEVDELGSGPASQLGTKEGYLLSYGRAWANASNTPYREYKHWLHEGGMATPFIVHWPAGIARSENNKVRQYAYLPDIMATFSALAGAEYPQAFQGNAVAPLQGKSLLSTLNETTKPVHEEAIFFEHEGKKAVREGKYKLVSKWNKNREYNWELYDMEVDRTETNDLAKSMPEKVDRLSKLWLAWADEMGVKPWSEILELRNKK
ncbi:arylsulfatase [Echinicola marina]|uniref:arylsulfatase n=1 Tax=Echinicola marina TaxID=2859768 RepID=UPI001CF686EB|nr:arylsulfatase [Echinicola marina]UCS91713.1 arylsulfatase [Echinicola marina]